MARTLAACGSGWHLSLAVEPGPRQEAFAPICAATLPAGSYDVTVNPRRLGVRDNPFHALKTAFAGGADFVLLLEEDFLLAPDALDLARWYRDHHRPHWAALNLLAGNCGSAGLLSDTTLSDALFETRCFNSIGVGMTAADWARAAPVWRRRHAPRYHSIRDLPCHHGWDWALFAMIQAQPDLRVVQPVTARCTHAGPKGEHCTPDFQQKAFARLALAAHRTERDFVLRSLSDLPAGIAAHIAAQNESAEHLGRRALGTDRGRGPLLAHLSALKHRLRRSPDS